MNVEIDLLKFEQSSGTLKWLPMVAAAFHRQLPQWRVDFAAALSTRNVDHQLELLHKIKGACFAVAAYRATEAITLAEAAHALGTPLAPSGLLHHLELVEIELHAIVATPPP